MENQPKTVISSRYKEKFANKPIGNEKDSSPTEPVIIVVA
jgi:hypothetical protein